MAMQMHSPRTTHSLRSRNEFISALRTGVPHRKTLPFGRNFFVQAEYIEGTSPHDATWSTVTFATRWLQYGPWTRPLTECRQGPDYHECTSRLHLADNGNCITRVLERAWGPRSYLFMECTSKLLSSRRSTTLPCLPRLPCRRVRVRAASRPHPGARAVLLHPLLFVGAGLEILPGTRACFIWI
ncbi:hypothetical protein OBBRIDRAFT_619686 [Obba rivulosa]|uniref:Uncharacterized protein n=1 Tax=Obba rivulosa TaxID=1052685 RepID=A0A8E2B2R9_9APHY|nr:hypothetical protein OBBRIDRAFT_619686 [Obba rivulosa]